MFDIGFSELLVIAVVALLVLGPERLPRAARFAGLWMRRARAQWYSVKSELEHELAADELRRSLRQTQDELRDANARMQREGEGLRREFDEAVSADVYVDAASANAADADVSRSSGEAGGAPSAPALTPPSTGKGIDTVAESADADADPMHRNDISARRSDER